MAWCDPRQLNSADRRSAGSRFRGVIVAGTMGATAFISMWVSNTATAAMMVPIVLSVVDAGIAVAAAIALFLIPVKGTLMDWETAAKLP